ncbi:MAG: hypothetical protein NTX32_06130 [Candidatus Firestonebacteria bacterium]|nr:hypothetical protein [Candidatus Firestonebacteria bacterium]
MKIFKIEKINHNSEKFNETFYFNLEQVSRVKVTVEDVEFFFGPNDTKRFTKKEIGDVEFQRVSDELAKLN